MDALISGLSIGATSSTGSRPTLEMTWGETANTQLEGKKTR